MKLVAVLLVAAVACVSAQTACNTSLLVPLLSDADLKQCTADSGVSVPPAGAISEASLAKACASKSCQALIAKVVALNIGDCSIGTFKVETDLINPIKKACAASGSTAGSSAAEVTTEGTTGSGSGSSAETPVSTKATVPTPTPSTTSGTSAVSIAAGAAVAAVVASMW